MQSQGTRGGDTRPNVMQWEFDPAEWRRAWNAALAEWQSLVLDIAAWQPTPAAAAGTDPDPGTRSSA